MTKSTRPKSTRPKYTSVGGYPIFYVDRDKVYCNLCATDVCEGRVNYESIDLYCDSCDEQIEAAYTD